MNIVDEFRVKSDTHLKDSIENVICFRILLLKSETRRCQNWKLLNHELQRILNTRTLGFGEKMGIKLRLKQNRNRTRNKNQIEKKSRNRI
ncbi:unnamed protein product [Trifolium pratense]|uniref:Uncharacterized protein n=1 Tax=Trifolium pratense TaxID=57577 RepID=A0ACB0KQM6_TRIPR|nr:unnamed protein product [Trifolium pratense]